jgi:uncharacterized protein YdbL (DUF1318 family)
MMGHAKKILVALTAFAIATAALAQQSLVNAKADGLVGERADGLVALVTDNPSAELRNLVAQVNAERMSEYNQIAAETDAPLEAVQARAGRQIIQRLPAGQYFMDASGRWRQK